MRRFFGAAVAALVIAAGGLRTQAAHVPQPFASDFTLVNQNGKPFTLSHQRGHPVVLFFGYTHCPDVCPTILANLKRARDLVGSPARDTVVALVTVDPARDTTAALHGFVSTFDPAFFGLTGTSAQLTPIYRAYNVQIVKQAENAAGYIVSHTTFIYYIGRDGRVHGFGTWTDPVNVLEDDLRTIASLAERRNSRRP